MKITDEMIIESIKARKIAEKRQNLIGKRICGVIMLLISIAVILVANSAPSWDIIGGDASCIVFSIPASMYLLFTKDAN